MRDLRLRIGSTIAALAALTPVAKPGPAFVALLAVLFLQMASHRPLPWRRLLHLEAFLVLLLVTLPFTMPGTPLFHLGGLAASTEGLWRAAVISLKVTASVLLVSLFLGATDPIALGAALRGLRVPEALVRLFIATTRYLGLIRDEFRRLHEAMRARGFRPRSNRHTWRTYGYLIGMLLVRALDRAERVEEAMRLRGYSCHFPHSVLPAPAPSDWIAATALASGALLLLVWDKIS